MRTPKGPREPEGPTELQDDILQTVDTEWVAFPGGELEGRLTRALCLDCRNRLARDWEVRRSAGGHSSRRPLCFQCYRAGLAQARALQAAGQRATASEARFQDSLPFDPVNKARLTVLKMERAAARTASLLGPDRFAQQRRRAQIAARQALREVGIELERRRLPIADDLRARAAATHAAELQLPESWLAFVVSR